MAYPYMPSSIEMHLRSNGCQNRNTTLSYKKNPERLDPWLSHIMKEINMDEVKTRPYILNFWFFSDIAFLPSTSFYALGPTLLSCDFSLFPLCMSSLGWRAYLIMDTLASTSFPSWYPCIWIYSLIGIPPFDPPWPRIWATCPLLCLVSSFTPGGFHHFYPLWFPFFISIFFQFEPWFRSSIVIIWLAYHPLSVGVLPFLRGTVVMSGPISQPLLGSRGPT